MRFEGGEAFQVTDNGGYVAFESFDGKVLFYLKPLSVNIGPLFARALSGGPEREIIDAVAYRQFYPVEDGIYYMGLGEKPGTYVLSVL
jgi:hypothetical protein